METVELCRDFRREDLHGKIHHGLESRCDGERRADVRGIEINDMSYNEYEGAKYFLDTLKKYSIDGWYEE